MASETKTFSINQASVPLEKGDTLTFKFVVKNTSTNNFTASLSAGSLNVSSLSVATGYASLNCPYFNSASLSSSAENTLYSDEIVFGSGISNFHDRNYLFVPNPLTGSLNSLYSTYGDVDYKFVIKPYDIVLTYLSDGTYVESSITRVFIDGNNLLRLKLTSPLSTLYRNNLMSGSFQRFLLLSRLEDENNAFLTFRKREGATSYGFLIPQNIAPDVLDNIDTITKEVKLKLLSDQSAITINTF
jgi:hypothetical protein